MKYKSVRVFARSSQGILFSRREDNGVWELPGGVIEKNESIIQAAKRELFEETGIKAKTAKLVGTHIIRGKKQGVVVCLGITGKLTPSWESPEVDWISNFEKDKRVRLYTKELIREILKDNNLFEIESKNFEVSLIFRFIIGKIKRKLRSIYRQHFNSIFN